MLFLNWLHSQTNRNDAIGVLATISYACHHSNRGGSDIDSVARHLLDEHGVPSEGYEIILTEAVQQYTAFCAEPRS